MAIIVFNGPPGTGKDEACLFFKQKGFTHLSFKYHLFRATTEFYDVSLEWFMDGYDDRAIKERPEYCLDGFSRREALIYVSEEIIKPMYGKDYFGVMSAKEIIDTQDYCFSDGGFVEELIPIINKFGAEGITIIQLTREGCDFSSDSRRYFNGNLVQEFILGKETPIVKCHFLPEQFPIRTYRVHNNDLIESFHRTLQAIHEKESNGRKINQKEEGVTDKDIM
jgi:hypothetical protein